MSLYSLAVALLWSGILVIVALNLAYLLSRLRRRRPLSSMMKK